jgi:hypothetical protein
MKVQVEDSLFEETFQRRYPNLIASLFHECVRRAHVVSLEREGKPFRRWMENQSKLQQDEADLVLDRSCELEARLAIDCVIIACAAASDWSRTPPRVGPEDLIQVVSRPLSILVENGGNDGAFLRCMGFGIDRRNLRTAYEQELISFDLGGGSESTKVLADRSPRERLRTWFVFDSDALTPGRPSEEAKKKEELCKRLGLALRYHRLERRAMESYLPAEALLQEWPRAENEKHQRAQAFGRMTAEQRTHFNLASGFQGDKARLGPGGSDAAQKPAVDAVYTSVPPADREQLQQGFGKKPLRELFEPERLPDELRRKDGQEAEMGRLIRSILRWL